MILYQGAYYVRLLVVQIRSLYLTQAEEDDFEYGGRSTIDLWSRVSHSLITTLLPSCFNDDINVSGSLIT